MRRAVCLLLLATSPVSADDWRMLDESEFLFEASWEGTALPGRFAEFDVQLMTGDEGIADATLSVTVDLAAADMNDPDINEAIVGDDWFSVATYPRATYTSRSIVEKAPGEYIASGELDLKGVTRAVEVPFSWLESAGRAEMKGELIIDRTHFNVGSGEWAADDSIGFDIRLAFKVFLVRQ